MLLRVVVLGWLLSGCSAAHEPDAGRADAGRDAGALDGAPDGGRDGGRDGGDGAGPRDAVVDAPRDGGPDDPGWVPLPGLPPDCRVERATHPERLETLAWETCVDGAGELIEGCQLGRGPTPLDGFSSDETLWLGSIRGFERRIRLLGRIDGSTTAAWREPVAHGDDGLLCRVSEVAVGGSRAAFVINFQDFTQTDRSRAWLYVDDVERIATTETPVHEFPAGFMSQSRRSIQGLWISAELIALQASPDGTLYTYRDGEWDILTGRDTVPGIPQNVTLVGDNLMWEAWQGVDDVRLVHAHWGGPATLWRDISPGDTKGFGTDGVDLAWFENHDRQPDGTYTQVELWTAPYQRDLDSVAPVRVRSMDVRANRSAVGGGWYARRVVREGEPARIEVFSLRDGSRRTFVSPTGFVMSDPLYATEREIMFRAGPGAIRFDPTLLPIDDEP